jgi:hypothetical protein
MLTPVMVEARMVERIQQAKPQYLDYVKIIIIIIIVITILLNK